MSKRVIIVDVSHLCYKAAFGGMPALSVRKEVCGVMQDINTTIPTYVLKRIHAWSKGGWNPTVICFDSKGANRSRNAYFAQGFGIDMSSGTKAYKSGRSAENDLFYTSVNATANILHRSGVCCIKSDRYEADDLIKACVDKAKATYPDYPIDIITGDADLVPLVDDQVSVFLSSKKMTWAESEDLVKPHYVQITPTFYQEYLESLTAFKNLEVPYNTVLLAKLLRGDKSDGIDGYPKFTPTKYKNLLHQMQDDDIDMSDLFRYDSPKKTYYYNGTDEEIPAELVASVPKEEKYVKFGEPPALIRMCNVLENYLDEDIIKHIRFVYNGINLNGAFTDLPESFVRYPAVVSIDIKGYKCVDLINLARRELGIHLSYNP